VPNVPFLLPDALVLGVGGVVGEAWMTGVLAGLEDGSGVDFRECEYIVGTSAGTIVGANLAAGRRPRRPDEVERDVAPLDRAPHPGTVEGLARAALRWSIALSSPLVLRAAPLEAPVRAVTRAALLAAIVPLGKESSEELRREMDRLGARFDGRLRICCADRRSARRVVFGAPGAPRATVAEAVAASCAIPGRYRPVEIDGREYVDGGAWSPSNIDAAPVGADARILCLNSTSALNGGLVSRAGPVVAIVRTTAAVEAMRMRAKGADVDVVGPDQRAADAMGTEFMEPGRRAAALAAGYAQGRELAEPEA